MYNSSSYNSIKNEKSSLTYNFIVVVLIFDIHIRNNRLKQQGLNKDVLDSCDNGKVQLFVLYSFKW